MSDPDRQDERLREAFAAPAGDGAPSPDCPADREIWAASRGELPQEKTTALLAHSQECPACAESFRAAAATASEMEGEPGSGTVHSFPEGRRKIVFAFLAAAAAILLITILPRVLTQEPPAAPGSVTDSIQATLWRVDGDSGVSLLDGQSIRPGDRLFVKIRNDRPAHVYVINRDLEGVASVLFPIEGAQWTNPLPAGEEIRLPGESSWEYDSWEVTSAGGRESFLVIASAEPLDEIESAMALMNHAVPRGPDTYLRGGDPGDSGSGTSEEKGAAALEAALKALAVSSREGGDIYLREIILENPR